MKLSDLGLVTAKPPVVFVSKLEPSGLLSSTGEMYYKGRLLTPVIVNCSTSKDIEPIETDELYVRESDVLSDLWEQVKDGVTIPKFVTDFSTGQEICLFQSETIRQWTQKNRAGKTKFRDETINKSFRERIADRIKAKESSEKTKKNKS